jgi:hypothetical protein
VAKETQQVFTSFALADSSWFGWNGAGAAPTMVSVRPEDLQRFGWNGAGAAPTMVSVRLASAADLIAAIPPLSLEIKEWLEGSNTLLGTGTSTRLTPEQKRSLLGYYFYCLSWILVLNLVLRAMNESVVYGEALGLITTMTPYNGHKFALMTRDAAWRVFDYMSTLDDGNSDF